jgi:DNA-binding response OmpR family regulator
VINTASHTVYRGKQKIELTDTEYLVLMYLETNKGVAKDAQAIYEGVWKETFFPSSTNIIVQNIMSAYNRIIEKYIKNA